MGRGEKKGTFLQFRVFRTHIREDLMGLEMENEILWCAFQPRLHAINSGDDVCGRIHFNCGHLLGEESVCVGQKRHEQQKKGEERDATCVA